MTPPLVTLTLNPALDLSAAVDRLTPGHKLRCRAERRQPGFEPDTFACKPGTCADRPLFEFSNEIGGNIQHKHNPLEAAGGVVVMPLAIGMEVAELVTRPFQKIFRSEEQTYELQSHYSI